MSTARATASDATVVSIVLRSAYGPVGQTMLTISRGIGTFECGSAIRQSASWRTMLAMLSRTS
jgi:hypothetical protein